MDEMSPSTEVFREETKISKAFWMDMLAAVGSVDG